jgi:4'-phosphopantetheinyl transferase
MLFILLICNVNFIIIFDLPYKYIRLPTYKVILNKKQSKIIIWKITESEGELISILSNEASLKKLEKLKAPSHRKQYLTSQILLKQNNLLAKVFKDENGKPLISDSSAHISISHDTDYVALMIANTPCGIDLQHLTKKVLRIKNKFYDSITDITDGDELIHFFTKVWSIKEAIYKVNGDPQVFFKEHIRITSMTDKQAEIDVLHPKYQNKFGVNIHKLDKIYLVYTT